MTINNYYLHYHDNHDTGRLSNLSSINTIDSSAYDVDSRVTGTMLPMLEIWLTENECLKNDNIFIHNE